MERTSNWLHEGYMDGLRGLDPDVKLSEYVHGDYSTGYLFGCEDRANGMKDIPYLGTHEKDLPVKRGQVVTIKKGTITKTIGKDPKPAGRTYSVKVDHTISGSQAYWDHHCIWGQKTLIWPTAPQVCWAGTGGYWTNAELNDVT